MKRTPLILFSAMILAAAGLLVSASPLQVPSGTWIAAGAMNSARSGAAAVLLQDGRILITGGNGANGPANSAELFGSNGSFSLAPPMNVPRSGHVAVVLQDGRVLVAGGLTSGGAVTNTAEIFDPVASTWTSVTGGMLEARSGHTAALLHDGRVAIAGGNNGTLISSTVEIFTPTQSRFSAVGTMSSPRTQHAMTVLQDGRVLIVGGNNGTAPVASSDLFDPVAGRISAGPNLSVARFAHSATTLLNGLVVVIGGNNGNANPAQMDVTPAELFDPTAATPAFTTLATNLATPREGHLAFLLPNNNNVLIVGGTSGGAPVASAELFLPEESSTGVWTYVFGATGSMSTARSSASGAANQVSSPSSVMQANGMLLVAGGSGASGNTLNSAELYGFATIQTDHGDYPPGQTVTMTGSGWKPGETVTLTLVESPLIDTGSPFTAVADANGNITDTSFTTDYHDVNVKFTLTAVGSVSRAQMTFTDSPNFIISGAVNDDVTGVGIAGATVSFYQSSSATCTSPTAWTPASTTTASGGTYTATGTGNITTLCAAVTAPANYTASGAVAGTGSTVVNSSEISTPDGSSGGTSTGNNFFVHSTAAVETIAASSASISYSASAQNVPLTATVTSTDGTVNTGSVSFTIKNGATVIGTATSGNVTSGSASVNYALPAQTAAQSYTIQASYNTGSGNSDVTDSSHQLTVSAAALTVTGITVNSKVYNGATTATLNTASAALVGVGSPDTVTLNASSYTANFSDKNVANGKAVTVTGLGLGGASAANYTLTQPTGLTGNITPAALTITAINRTKTFGQTVTFAGTEFTTSGLISPDTVTSVTLTSAGAAATATVAGSPYSIVPSAAVGSGLTNYTITYVNGTLTVIPALAFVRSAGASTRSGAFTVTISPTAGDFLAVVVMQIEGGVDPTVMTDNKASVYTKDCDLTYNQGFGAGRRMTVYHLQNAPSGITTVDITVSANTRAIVAEYSGMPTSGTVLDVCGTVNNQTSGVTSWTSPATTTTANDVVLGIAETGYTSNAGYAAGSGWTGRQEQSNPPDGDDSYLEDKVGVAAGSYTATGTTTASVGESTVIIAYKATPPTIAPTITSTNSAAFAVGTAGTFTVTATGTPAPTLSETGALPTGVTFTPATGILAGTPAAGTVGTYPITITAQNGITPNATQNFTLTVNQAPVITSANSTSFTAGTAGTFTVTATGFPIATLAETATLPSGVTFTDNKNNTGTLAWTSAVASGSYGLSFTANNGVTPNATQNFTLAANTAPAITSANSTSATAGTAGTFTVTATGFPIATLAETALLPSGVTFTDNKNNTGTLAWTAAVAGGSYALTFTASNGVTPSATQSFTLTVNQAPAISSANSTSFTAGTAGTFTVTAMGFPIAVLTQNSTLPSGVTFTDNKNNTGTLSWTAAVASGSYALSFTASNGVTPNATQSFTLAANTAPAISSANSTSATAGTAGTFTVTATGFPIATLAETALLPSGVTFTDNKNNTGTLAWTAAVAGGSYGLTFTASNGVTPSATQSFTLTVNQAPAITSANSTSFTAGTAGTFTVTATGFPIAVLTQNSTLPSGVTFTDNKNNTGTLSWTAAVASGSYGLSFTASNGVTPNATQSFTLAANTAPAISSANSTSATAGTAGTFTVTATGFPIATLAETALLPSGVTFTDNKNNTGTLAWTAAVAGGSYGLTFTASNGVTPSATQSFTLTVNQAPAISSANSTSFTAGTAGTFTVTATGFPIATLAETATLPSGVTFTDNKNNTGTLAWTAAVASGSYGLSFTASNGVTPNATQSFTLAANTAPTISSANSTSFTAGTAGTFTVMATGFPIATLAETATLPSGVTFTDNKNNTGTLAWTAAVAGGSYGLTFTAGNGVLPNATQSFTLTVNQAPAITSANNTIFTAGTAGTFTVTSTGFPIATLAETVALPSGVTFTDNKNNTGTLAWTAAVVSGAYGLTFTASNGVLPSATQNFTLIVNQVVTPLAFVRSAGGFTESGAFTATISPTAGDFLAVVVMQIEGGADPSVMTDNKSSVYTKDCDLTYNQGFGAGRRMTVYHLLNAPSGITTVNITTTVPTRAIVAEYSGMPTSGTVLDVCGTVNNQTTGVTSWTSPATTTTASDVVLGIAETGYTANAGYAAGTGWTGRQRQTNASDGDDSYLEDQVGVAAGSYTATGTSTASVGESTVVIAYKATPPTIAPTITSANTAGFTVGTAGSFTVTATGTPIATLVETASLPNGVTFTDNKNNTGTLAWTAAVAAGNYSLAFTASNGVLPNATQSFTLGVNTAPAITSTNSASATAGTAGTFTVTATGFPIATLAETATLPNGVTFTDNKNNTGTLAWTAAVAGGSYGLTFTAGNGVLPNATQSFTLTVNQAPAITSANNTTFMTGTAGTFTVTATGFPIATLAETAMLPSGVTFTDNKNNTGTLAWTAAVAGGSYALTFTAGNGVLPSATQSFTMTVSSATLTYTANAASRPYGAANPALTGTVTGFIGSDTQANSTTGTLTFTTTATATSGVGTYPINGSGLTANNGKYAFVQAASNATALTITPATPTITVTGGTFPYTGSSYAATATAVGVDGVTPVSGTFSFTYTPPGNSTAPINAGTYSVTASFTSTNPNYSNATGTGSIIITSSGSTNVTLNNANTPVAAFNSSSFSKPMTVNAGGTNTVAFATVWVDEGSGPSGTTFNVTATYGGQAMTSAGATAYDYDYAPISSQVFYLVNPPTGTNTLVVNATASSGTIQEVVANLVSYNGVNQTTPVRPGTYQTLNSLNGATVGGFSATLASNTNDLTLGAVEATYAFATPASNQTVDGTASAYFRVGSDHATAGASSISDTWSFTNPYAFYAYVGFSIQSAGTPPVLTYTANPASKVSGTANPTFSGTVTGFIGSDTLANSTTGTLTFTSPATTSSGPGSYAINGSGLTANNGKYTFVQAPSNSTALTVTPSGCVSGSPSYYQYDLNDNSNTASSPFPGKTKNCDMIVVYGSTQLNSASFTGSPTFSDGTPMPLCTAAACNYTTSNGSMNTRLWTGISTGGTTPTYTFNLTASGQTIGGVAVEISGVTTFDQMISSQLLSSSATSITSPSITTTHPNEILLCLDSEANPIADGAHFIGVNSPFTLITFGNQAIGYYVAATPGTYSCTATRAAGTQDETIAIAGFY